MNPLCTGGYDVENTCHSLFSCPDFLAEKNILKNITNIDGNIFNQVDATVTKTLLFDNSKYCNEVNLRIKFDELLNS